MEEPPHTEDRGILQDLFLLFITFFKIAAFVVGGGLAMLPVIEETFLRKRKMLTQEELLDMVTLTQTIPGVIAVNSAVYVGWKIRKLPGAIVSVLGVVMPSFLIILLIAWLFPNLKPNHPLLIGAFAGVRSAVTGLLLVTAIRMIRKNCRTLLDAIIITASFILVTVFRVNPGLLILGVMPVGVLLLRWQPQPKEAK